MSTVSIIEPRGSLGVHEIVAANIRAEAARAGFSQVALARALHKAQSVTHDRWVGRTPWRLDELDAVAAVIGVDVSVLLDMETAHAESVGRAARLKGLEPPTFWYGVAPVIDLFTRHRFA